MEIIVMHAGPACRTLKLRRNNSLNNKSLMHILGLVSMPVLVFDLFRITIYYNK